MKNNNSVKNKKQINEKVIKGQDNGSPSTMQAIGYPGSSSLETASSHLLFVKDISGLVMIKNRYRDTLIMGEELWHKILNLATNFGWNGEIKAGKIPEFFYLCLCGRRAEVDLQSVGPLQSYYVMQLTTSSYPFPTNHMLFVLNTPEMTNALERWVQSVTEEGPNLSLMFKFGDKAAELNAPAKDCVEAIIHFCRADDPGNYLSILDEPMLSEEYGTPYYDA